MNSKSESPFYIASPGHAAFAAAMVAIGVIGAVKGAFTATWSGVPKDLPARTALAYVCALICVACGLGLLVRRSAAISARVLLVAFGLWMLAFRIPLFVGVPPSTGPWWATGDTAVMIATTWLLCARFGGSARQPFRFIESQRGVGVARMLYGLGLIPFGVAHFTYLDRTVSMVPGWLPFHLAWAEATGVAFIAAGLALVIGVYARLAATLVALQIALFTLLVWIPIIAGRPTAGDWTEFVSSCVLTACAWVVADSWRATRSTVGVAQPAAAV